RAAGQGPGADPSLGAPGRHPRVGWAPALREGCSSFAGIGDGGDSGMLDPNVLRRALLSLIAMVVLASPAGAAPRQYAVGPVPAWVEPVAADRTPRPGAEGLDGQEFLL